MGRDTTGVKGIELEKDDEVIGMVVIKRDATLLVVTEKGFGKCSELTTTACRSAAARASSPSRSTDKTG